MSGRGHDVFGWVLVAAWAGLVALAVWALVALPWGAVEAPVSVFR